MFNIEKKKLQVLKFELKTIDNITHRFTIKNCKHYSGYIQTKYYQD